MTSRCCHLPDFLAALVLAVRGWTYLVELDGAGGCIVVSPSVHACGTANRWGDGTWRPDAPRWLVAKGQSTQPSPVDSYQFAAV